MSDAVSETAFAKVNLGLHVRRRRADGYHELETIFAFVDDGDRLSVTPSAQDGLTITGPCADGLSFGADNLVLRALDLARAHGCVAPPLAITLDKRLPMAAGLGGGSADAGALLRLILRHWRGEIDPERLMMNAATLGADVPACIASVTALGTGLGDKVQPIALQGASGTAVLLVNPLVPCPTGPVFAAWDEVDRGALSLHDDLMAGMRQWRNDLEAAAVSICPQIDDVMTLLRAQLPAFARMSGSGATCFALFADMAQMQHAAMRIADDHPDWWVMGGQLR